MTKKVKGGIVKHYCDKCNKLIYDTIPKKEQSAIKVFGIPVIEIEIKRYCEFRMIWENKKLGIKAGEYCLECAKQMGYSR